MWNWLTEHRAQIRSWARDIAHAAIFVSALAFAYSEVFVASAADPQVLALVVALLAAIGIARA